MVNYKPSTKLNKARLRAVVAYINASDFERVKSILEAYDGEPGRLIKTKHKMTYHWGLVYGYNVTLGMYSDLSKYYIVIYDRHE